ncbi:DNA-processing protein DprA [Mycoplasmopsis gallinarum]|uniref:DNA-processing protein DprA n=1 Tax=Mycoplasmopsis gallinarum TaxID=29557 RepID=UPI000489A0C3|nr:DNA-processing protein DprA [Mycoplasmopsis gallinarum]
MNDLLIYFSHKYKGNNFEIFKALKNGESVNTNDLNNWKNIMSENQIEYITIFDEIYPKELKKAKYPPFVIYLKGNKELLKKNKIQIEADYVNDLCLKNLEKFKSILNSEHTLLISDFKGFNDVITIFCDDNKINKILILAQGIENFQKNWNYEDNLIISIYPAKTNPKYIRFKERNLLASELGKFLILLNSYQNSKLLNLVNYYLENNKEIYCFPGETYDDGNTELIKMGATMITHFADIKYY